jgi:hypothetical protein
VILAYGLDTAKRHREAVSLASAVGGGSEDSITPPSKSIKSGSLAAMLVRPIWRLRRVPFKIPYDFRVS